MRISYLRNEAGIDGLGLSERRELEMGDVMSQGRIDLIGLIQRRATGHDLSCYESKFKKTKQINMSNVL
jgi:hypothetical protein